MSERINLNKDYSAWLKERKADSEMLNFYRELGADIVDKRATAKRGDGFRSKLSHDLMAEFPDMKGSSKRNLEIIRQCYLFYMKENPIAKQAVSQFETNIGQQAVAQLVQIPWGRNITKNLPNEFRLSLRCIEAELRVREELS